MYKILGVALVGGAILFGAGCSRTEVVMRCTEIQQNKTFQNSLFGIAYGDPITYYVLVDGREIDEYRVKPGRGSDVIIIEKKDHYCEHVKKSSK